MKKRKVNALLAIGLSDDDGGSAGCGKEAA